MSVPGWDRYFMDLLPGIAARSKDPNTKVACIIVDNNNVIRATGYNSFPRGIRDDVHARLERPEKYFCMEHAERNAIYAAARTGVTLDGCRIYVPGLPCMDCARAIIQVGINQVVYSHSSQATWEKTVTMYNTHFNKVRELLDEANVDLVTYEEITNLKIGPNKASVPKKVEDWFSLQELSESPIKDDPTLSPDSDDD